MQKVLGASSRAQRRVDGAEYDQPICQKKAPKSIFLEGNQCWGEGHQKFPEIISLSGVGVNFCPFTFGKFSTRTGGNFFQMK